MPSYLELERIPSGVFFAAQDRFEQAYDEGAHAPTKRFPVFARSQNAGIASKEPVLCLPLLDVTVDVRVDCTIAETRLVQRFTNISDAAIPEAHYTFPLYDGSAVTSFRFHIGDSKVLEGQVKPKEEAKREYKRAIEKMEAAALLEEHTPEVFETMIGNIPPRTTVKAEITYVNELKADLSAKGVLVTIPTSIAPRYGQGPEEYSANSNVTEAGLNISVAINAPDPIQKVDCRTHPISLEMGKFGLPTEARSWDALANPPETNDGFNPRQATARLSDRSARMDKDFVLLILTSGRSLLRSRALLSPTNSLGHAALMVSLRPSDLFSDAIQLDAFVGEIVFLADRSGSMRGPKMNALREALRVFLKSLPQTCRFNLFSFGSSFSSLWEESKVYDQANLDEAVSHVSRFDADMGGTDLLPALNQLVDRRLPNGGSTQVILLTDGEVWKTDKTIDFVRKKRSELGDEIRFFALGIGNEVSHRLIEGIGTWGGGFGEVTGADMQGKWQERVIGMLKGALKPQTWECEVNLGNGLVCKSLSVDDFTTTTNESSATLGYVRVPHVVPLIHHYGRKSIYFLLDIGQTRTPETITIIPTSKNNQTASVTLEVTQTTSHVTAIQHLAAKAALLELESQVASQSAKFDVIARQNATFIGEKYAITSKWTSFVAVDLTTKAANEITSYHAPLNELAMLTSFEPTERKRNRPRVIALSSSSSELDPDRLRDLDTVCRCMSESTDEDDEILCLEFSDRRRRLSRRMASISTQTGASRSKFSAFMEDAYSLESPTADVDHINIDWSSIVTSQLVNGAFQLEHDMRVKLSTHFCASTRDEILQVAKALPDAHPLKDGEQMIFLDTLMVIQYVRTHLNGKKGLWELMILKAEEFINKATSNQESAVQLADMLNSSLSHAHFENLSPSSSHKGSVCCLVCDRAADGDGAVERTKLASESDGNTSLWSRMSSSAKMFVHKSMQIRKDATQPEGAPGKESCKDSLSEIDRFNCVFTGCSAHFASWEDLWRHQTDNGHVICS